MINDAEIYINELEEKNTNVFNNLYLKTILAIAKKDTVSALSYIKKIEAMPTEIKYGLLAEVCLALSLYDKAARYIEEAYIKGGLLPSNIPDNYFEYPPLKKAVEKPEFINLLEIRENNLSLSNYSQ